MFCLDHFYIKVSIEHGCKVHVISVKMKSMSVTLFKILTISCCLSQTFQFTNSLELCANYLPLLFRKFLTSLLAVNIHSNSWQYAIFH